MHEAGGSAQELDARREGSHNGKQDFSKTLKVSDEMPQWVAAQGWRPEFE